MFFRRVFSRKEQSIPNNQHHVNEKSVQTPNTESHRSPYRSSRRTATADEKQRNATVIQLTPLWENIIRNKCLPYNINEKDMFEEFRERLGDPEWQVRQHALRVLVDVLIVMGQRSDQFFSPLILPLVQNLAHGTTAVRKGALDALKVYMTETAMPETILLEIINVGMEHKNFSEKDGGRQCYGVMLSLPSLAHTSVGTPKQAYILRAVIDALTTKMVQITYQEVALKALLRIRELIGGREFSEYMDHGVYREFELLCNVYGLPSSPLNARDPAMESYLRSSSSANRQFSGTPASAESNCKVKRTELCWRDPNDDSYDDEGNPKKIRRKFHSASKVLVGPPKYRITTKEKSDKLEHDRERVIMETEIKIQDTAVTMRIFEAENEMSCDNYSEDDVSSVGEHSGVVRVLTDSELDDTNNTSVSSNDKDQHDDNSGRNTATGIKRVTFGGEEFKLRTPDSDSVLQSDNDDLMKTIQQLNYFQSNKEADNKPTNNLTVSRPKTASMPITSVSSPVKDNPIRHKSASPNKRGRRASFSSIEDLQISPRSTHSGIEVLHNLQRSPLISPSRSRRNSTESFTGDDTKKTLNVNSLQNKLNDTIAEENSGTEKDVDEPKVEREKEKISSWESLGLVDEQCIRNMKSGDWRLRSHAMCTIEEVLKSTDNLALVQPYLESLFRTLLSSEKHPDVVEDKRRIIINLISRLPLENLESRATQIILGLCRQGGASSNRVAKALFQRLSRSAVLMKLISDDFLKARSSRFRENALQMVLYSLMTFPSTHFDISTCIHKSAQAANDRKKRVRQAALDVLAVLGQISSPKFVLDEVIQALKNEKEAFRLIAAIKARLSRKQLPTVTSDGNVQYALRIPTPPTNSTNYFFGADVDWISAGVGSVSPTSPKKRFDIYPPVHSYNYSSSDSNRSSTENYTWGKSSSYETAVNFPLNRNYGLHKSNSNGTLTSSHVTGSKDSLHRALNDDKNTHFVIATSIPSSEAPFLFNGGLQRMNIQSQSFPDLSKSTIGKTGHYTQNRINASNKSSKLPVASRFPSMEANIEAVRGTNKTDNNYYSNYNYYRSNLSNRNGGSLPRKLNVTNIPVRTGYFNYNNYSHVAPDYQSSNDESRPSTHPIEKIQQPNPKRFINVSKYLNEKSSTDYSSDEKLSTNFGYKEQPKLKPVIIDIPLKELKKTISDEISSETSPNREESVETISNGEISSAEISGTSTPTRPLSAKLSHAKDTNLSSSNETLKPSSPSPSPSPKIVISVSENPIDKQQVNLVTSNAHSLPSSPVNQSVTSQHDTAEHVEISPSIQTDFGQISGGKEAHDLENGNLNLPSNVIETKSLGQTVKTGPVEYDEIDASRKANTNDDASKQNPQNSLTYILGEKISDEPDSRSLSSSEVSSDGRINGNNENFRRDSLQSEPSASKFHPSFLTRKRKVAAIKPSPLATHSSPPKPKSTEMFPKTLHHFEKAREASNTCLAQLDSPNWESVINGLQSFVRLIRHHPEIVEANIHAYCIALSKQVKNLRSQVSRSACQASAEFFESHAKHLEQESDDLATQLFNRTADTNKFLRADAINALNSMCDNLSVPKVIQTIILRGATHQNAIVRAAAAALCSRIVLRLGCDRVFAMNREYRDKLILAGANLLMEGSLETRNNAKTMFKQLSIHPSYNRVLLDVIPQRIYRNIEKSLKSIK